MEIYFFFTLKKFILGKNNRVPSIRMNRHSSRIHETARHQNLPFLRFHVRNLQRRFARIGPEYISRYPIDRETFRAAHSGHECLDIRTVVMHRRDSVAYEKSSIRY